MARVGIVIGSKTDRDLIKFTTNMLEQLGIDYEVSVISGQKS